MTHRFIAVDVGTGDAFFLQRGDFSALVDGGEAPGFPRRLHRATGVDSVNVIVCTHNDRDHANGVLEFLEDGGHADECWLPATWMEAVYRLCTASQEEVESLAFNEEKELPEEVHREEEEEINHSDLEDLLSEMEDESTASLRRLPLGPWLVVPTGILIPHGVARSRALVPPLLADAFRILNIAVAAGKLQIPIRWFDPERPPSEQPSLPLSVVNARPVTSLRRARLSLKDVIKLTTVNRTSLVLYSPPDDAAAGALFCGDSGFENLSSPPADKGMIVTAPHHGSSDSKNVGVYHALDVACAAHSPLSWLWVRSDKDCRRRPCKEYLERQIRFCTRCRGQTGKQPFQSVVATGRNGVWHSQSRPCNCDRAGDSDSSGREWPTKASGGPGAKHVDSS